MLLLLTYVAIPQHESCLANSSTRNQSCARIRQRLRLEGHDDDIELVRVKVHVLYFQIVHSSSFPGQRRNSKRNGKNDHVGLTAVLVISTGATSLILFDDVEIRIPAFHVRRKTTERIDSYQIEPLE